MIVVHEWWGHNQHARNQAIRLAKAGYVGFALDMYGKGKVTTHPPDAQAFATEATKDPQLVKARFLAALDVLQKDPHVDPERVAAIGYCFGGGIVLAMARQGVDLDAVVSFHGSIATQQPAAPGAVKARLLVLNGEDDGMVTADQIAAFKKEMTAARARYEFVNLPHAKHSLHQPGRRQGRHGGARLQRRSRPGVLGQDAEALRRGVPEVAPARARAARPRRAASASGRRSSCPPPRRCA